MILSQKTMKHPPTNTVISPKIIPGIPPFTTLLKLIPAPRVSPTNGIKIFQLVPRKSASLYQDFQLSYQL